MIIKARVTTCLSVCILHFTNTGFQRERSSRAQVHINHGVEMGLTEGGVFCKEERG